MQKLKRIKNLVLSLTIILCMGSGIIASAKSENEPSGIPWEQRKELTYEYDEIMGQIDEFALYFQSLEGDNKTKLSLQDKEVNAAYDEIVRQLEIAVTVYSINEINYYQDINNKEYAKKQERMQEEVAEITDAVYAALREAVNSPYQDFFIDLLGEEIAWEIADYEEMTDGDMELMKQETSLIQEYDQAVRGEYEDEEERYHVIAPVYKKLIELRTKRAEKEGYDHYAEYIYDSRFNRDYSLEQAKELLGEIKDDASPIYRERILKIINQMDWDALYEIERVTAKERLNRIEPYLSLLSLELKEAYDYLRENQLYDLEADSGKAQVGFTITLPYYDDAFIFDSPYGYFEDYATLAHEFGHYYHFYQSSEPYLFSYNNVDVSEIHSQALEAFFLEYSKDMFGEEAGESYRTMQLIKYMDNIIMGAIISAFEIEVYENPELTIEEMSILYASLIDEYEYWTLSDVNGYEWVDINHIFQSPGYYMGYVTSGLSALDLLSISHRNRNKAVDMYMELVNTPSKVAYCEAIYEAGMRDIFEAGTVAEIVKITLDYAEGELPEAIFDEEEFFSRLAGLFMLMYAISVAVVVIGAFIGIAMITEKRRKHG